MRGTAAAAGALGLPLLLALLAGSAFADPAPAGPGAANAGPAPRTPSAAGARRLTDEGAAAYEDGNFPFARACFEEAARLDPMSADPLANLALLAYAEGDAVGAARRFVEALTLDAGHAAARAGFAEFVAALSAPDSDPADSLEALALAADLAERAGLESAARAARAGVVRLLARLHAVDAGRVAPLLERALGARAPSPEEAEALAAAARAADPARRRALLDALRNLGADGDVRAAAEPSGGLPLDGEEAERDPAGLAAARGEREAAAEALALIRRGDTGRAKERIRRLERETGRTPVVIFLEASRLARGRARKAALEEMAAFDPALAPTADLLLAAGALLARLGARDRAAAFFAEGARRFPAEPEFHFHLALDALATDRPAEARDALKLALAARPDSAKYHYFLVEALERCGEADAAAAARERVLAGDPAGRYASWLRRKLGASPAERLVREAAGEAALVSDEALDAAGGTAPVALLERLAANRPDLAAPLRLLAERKSEAGDHDGALACLLALRSRRGLTRVEPAALADAWLAAGFPAESLAELEAVEAAFPGDPYLALKRGLALFALGDTAEARLRWQAVADGGDLAAAAVARDLLSGDAAPAVTARADRGPALDRLARRLLGYGDKPGAAAILERRAAEGSTDALLMLVELHLAARKFDRALALIDAHRSAGNAGAEILALAADLCRRAGNPRRGIAYLEEAERAAPLGPREQVLLGDLLLAAGRAEEALVRYTRALKAGLSGLRRGEALKKAAAARAALGKEPSRGR